MQVPKIHLNDGKDIPQLGYGVWKIADEDVTAAVKSAFDIGYRHIDTARIYGNEAGVGRAIKASDLPREELFITTKLWNDDQGYDAALRAFDASMARLGLDYCDLYLIHWPVPVLDQYLQAWKALVRLKEEKRIKSIGVCNFRIADLERLMRESDVKPVVNQIELHPYFQQRELRVFHEKHHIATEAWSPIGQGQLLNDPTLLQIAQAHNKTAAQIILRWHIEIGNIVIPKSQSPKRMAENFAIFDFELTAHDHDLINALDKKDGRIGPNPAEFSG